MKNIFFLTLLSIVFISCGPKVIYKHKEELKEIWTYGDSVKFEYEIVDISKPYNLVLNVSYNTTFSYENLYINVSTVFPDGGKTTAPVSLQFADNFGDWQGDCSGRTCTIPIEMSAKAYFKTAGKYGITIEQYSREASLEGINSLELVLVESE